NTFAPIWVGTPENCDSRVLVKRTVCRELAVGAAANALDACTSGPATTEVKTRSVPIVPAARCSMTPSAGAPRTRQARARPSVAAAPPAPRAVADAGRAHALRARASASRPRARSSRWHDPRARDRADRTARACTGSPATRAIGDRRVGRPLPRLG